MSWKNGWRKSDYQSWGNYPKNQWKKPDKTEGTLISWDGKRVALGEGDTPSSLSSSSRGSTAPAKQGEDPHLKDMVRRLLDGDAKNDPDLIRQAKLLVEETPQEALRREQRELNQRRRDITRKEKLRTKLDNTQNRFTDWKSRVQHTIRVEETRFSDEVRDLRKQLSQAEKDEEMEDEKQLDSEDDLQDIRQALHHQERMNMSPMRQNNQITQQLAQLTQAMSQIALTAAAGNPAMQQELLKPAPGLAMQNVKPEAPLVELDQEEYLTEVEIMNQLAGLPQQVVDGTLEIIRAKTTSGWTAQGVHSVVQELQDNQRFAAVETMPVVEGALKPFGKANTPKQRRKMPYEGGKGVSPAAKSPKLGAME